MARILAKAVNCTDLRDGEPCDRCPSCEAIREGRALDVIELDAASNNRVDDMRELLPRVYTAASDLAPQGLHHRRGPAHQGRLGRPPQDPRGAARRRPLHLLHDRPEPDPPGRRLTPPALHVPAARERRDRGQARAHPRGRGPPGRAGRARARGPPRRAAACATPSRCSTRSSSARTTRSTVEVVTDLLGLADEASVDAFIEALVRRRHARRDRACSTSSRPRAATWSASATRSSPGCASSSSPV